jgi:hypothetical protein
LEKKKESRRRYLSFLEEQIKQSLWEKTKHKLKNISFYELFGLSDKMLKGKLQEEFMEIKIFIRKNIS